MTIQDTVARCSGCQQGIDYDHRAVPMSNISATQPCCTVLDDIISVFQYEMIKKLSP